MNPFASLRRILAATSVLALAFAVSTVPPPASADSPTLRRDNPSATFLYEAAGDAANNAGHSTPHNALHGTPHRADSLRAVAPATPRLDITLFSTSFMLRGAPSSLVVAERTGADGRSASAQGFTDFDGLALVRFTAFGGPGVDPVIRPGDQLSVASAGGRPIFIDVPTIRAAAAHETDRIYGIAPPSSTVTVTWHTGEGFEAGHKHELTAGADGTWEVPSTVTVDLPSSGLVGEAWIRTPDGDRFAVRFGSLTLDVTLGATSLTGTASPGAMLSASVVPAGSAPTEPSIAIGQLESIDGLDWTTVQSGPMRGPAGPSHTFAPGDVIVLDSVEPPLLPSTTLSVTLPALSLTIDPAADTAQGSGSPGSILTLDASGPSTSGIGSATASVTVAPDGTWSADLSGEADLRAGWRAWIRASDNPAVHVSALALVAGFEIGVNLPEMLGLAEPGSVVTATLIGASGEIEAQRTVVASDTGGLRISWGRFQNFADADDPDAEPGDRIELATVVGDPTILNVPTLSASPDLDANTIIGVAPPGSSVRATITSLPGSPSVTAVADAGGAYAVDFSGVATLSRPAQGDVRFSDTSGAAFYTSWSATELSIEFGTASVAGNGPPGRLVNGVLLGPDGREVASDDNRAFDPNSPGVIVLGPQPTAGLAGFSLSFVDITGAPVIVESGDRLDVSAGDEEISLSVPMLEGAALVDDDIVTGRAEPGAQVTVSVGPPLGGAAAQETVVTGPDGTFAFDFSDAFDIRFNDIVTLQSSADGHRIARELIAPGLLFNLDTARLEGSLTSDAKLDISLERAGRVIASERTEAGQDGSFEVVLPAPDGSPAIAEPGDRLTVAERFPGSGLLTLTIPDLTVSADPATERVSGQAQPGGELVVIASDVTIRLDGLGLSQAWPAISGSGAWAAGFVPSRNVRPGTQLRAYYQLPGGHIVQRTHVVPFIAVEHDGPNVCGYAPSGAEVDVSLLSADGAERATGTTAAARDGRFRAILRSSDGSLIRSMMSDTLRAAFAGETHDITLPQFGVTPDWASGMVTVDGTPGTLILAANPAVRCGADQDDNGDTSLAISGGNIRPDGTLRMPLPGTPFPGTGFELFRYAPNDHKVFRPLWRAFAEIWVGTDRVSGKAGAGRPTHLSLLGADGAERASTDTITDADGILDARFGNEAAPGGVSTIAPGDTVRIEVDGEMVEVAVEPLGFDWSPGRDVIGTAPPHREVMLSLRLEGERIVTLPVFTDSGGRFELRSSDVPPRGSWTIADIVAIRAALHTPGGHRIVSQTDGFEAPPEPIEWTIFMPSVRNQVSGSD